jgi:hypothetical protein
MRKAAIALALIFGLGFVADVLAIGCVGENADIRLACGKREASAKPQPAQTCPSRTCPKSLASFSILLMPS